MNPADESNPTAKQVSPSDLNQSFNDVNKALSEYLRQVELHRAYYALKKVVQSEVAQPENI